MKRFLPSTSRKVGKGYLENSITFGLAGFFTVDSAESGREAVARVTEQRYEVVLLDIMMPGLNGLETLERIRQTYPIEELAVIGGSSKNV